MFVAAKKAIGKENVKSKVVAKIQDDNSGKFVVPSP